MAKSQIIKDLANGVVDTQTALKRAKVLLQELDNIDLLQWINYEIGGYPENVDVPEYRIISGPLYGSYFKGSIANHIKYNDVPISLGNMSKDMQTDILTIELRQGIGALKDTVIESQQNGNNGLAKPIPAEYYPIIAQANNDLGMMITTAYVNLNMASIRNIFPIVENKLLDILSYLEKQFGNLDDLDIDIESKTPDELTQITNHIYIMIYKDNSVSLGNNNKIKDSTIASTIKNE